MRKKAAGLLAAVLAFTMLAGCGNEVAENATNNQLNVMKVEKYVTLGDYSNLTVEVEKVEVTEAEVDELVLSVYQSNVTAENGGITNRAVANGDTVNIDYKGTKDGVAFSGGTAAGAELTIGSGQFIDGFEDGLIGVKPGETVDLNLSFPADYGVDELNGAAVVFTVTVNFINPSAEHMNDAVVAGFGYSDFTSVAELRQYCNDYLMESAEMTYLYSTQDAIMEELMKQSTIAELPESFVSSYNHVFSENLEKMGAQYGIDGETYAYYFYGMDAASYIALYAEVQARQEIILQTIANELDLNVDDEELETLLQEYASAAGAASVEEFIGDLSKEEYRNYFMCDKVMEYLVENATVVEPVAAE